MLDPFAGSSLVGQRIGRYRVVRKLAEGGMGAVFVAEQDSPRRTVALKVLRPELTTPARLRRFEHEAQILGRLSHPCIAQIFEAGSAGEGDAARPFFVMELVEGAPLNEYVERAGLDVRQRVALMQRVCDAVQHAHEKGVVHRDLKPANVLVTADGTPKVLDFGVARVTDSDFKTTTLMTDVGQLLGTVPYMSPEQVSGDPDELDTRTDVYSLGVVLYQVLTDAFPYDVADKLLHEAVHVIREVDPQPLSSVDRTLRGDLDTIVAKALEKDKARRYASAAELGSDLQRYLRDEPIVARPPSALYQLGKFARRHKPFVAGAVAVLLALVVGAIVSATQAVRASRAERLALARLGEAQAARQEEAHQRELAVASAARAEAEAARAEAEAERSAREARKARAVTGFLQDMLSSADPSYAAGEELTVRELFDQASAGIDAGVLDEPAVEGAVRRTLSISYATLGAYDSAESQARRALELLADLPADEVEPAELGDAEYALGLALTRLGRHDEARPVLEQLLARREELLGPEHPTVASTLDLLAAGRYEQGDLEGALEIDRRALAIARAAHGERHPDVVRYLRGMGFHLHELRRDDEALALLEEAGEILDAAGEGETPVRARQLRQLATVQAGLGRRAEAEASFRRVLAIHRATYEADHPVLADAAFSLGSHLAYTAPEESEELVREALAIRRARLGDHRDTATAIAELGGLRARAGALDEAQELLEESLAMRTRLYGEDSAAAGDSLLKLGYLAEGRGDPADAERWFRRASEVWSATLGADHPDVANPLRRVARLARARGDLEEAERLSRRVLELRRGFPRAHAKVHEARDDLAQVLLDREAWAEARALLEEWLADCEAELSPGANLFPHIDLHLSAARAGLGEFDEAEPRMLAAFERIDGNPRLWLETKREACGRVARMYELWNRPADAVTWRERCAGYDG